MELLCNSYILNENNKTLINLGEVSKYSLAKYQNNGLISPDLENKLQEILNLYNLGSLKNFKLSNDKSYFYLFNSQDKLLIFKFYENCLFIELNRQVVINKIQNYLFDIFCNLIEGDVGPDGDIGMDGKSNSKKTTNIGQKGINGNNGVNYLTILQKSDLFINNIAVIDIKKMNNFIYKKLNIIGPNCSFQLSINLLNFKDHFLSVGTTTDAFKNIKYIKIKTDIKKPILDFPQWTVMAGCFDQKRHILSDLQWYDSSFDILMEQKPIDGGCADSYWFCMNSIGTGDINVGIQPTNYENISSSSSSSSSNDTDDEELT
jgi:hypothetical protein